MGDAKRGSFAGLAQALSNANLIPEYLFSPFSLGGIAVLGYFLAGFLGIPAV